jgi:RND superfamily putative drug exporter
LAFGSLVLPIKAALMSALTLGSTMGILTWMFVDGHGSGLMNYTPQPLMAPMIGLIIAVIYGLSTDYEVFLVSRMVEARDRGMSTTESIRVGTATTGRLITAAALVLAVVAGAFVFSDLVMMKYLAFGLLIALLLDATIVRMFLVPAIMKLLGDDCWWAPKWMKRLQHKIGLGETTLPDELKRPVVRQPAGALVSAVAAPAHPVGGPGQSIDEAPTTRFGTAKSPEGKSPEGKSPEGKSPEGKSPEGKSSEGRDIGSWLSEIRGKVLPRSDRVEPSIAGEPTSVIADPAPVEEPPTTAIPTQSTSLSAEETRAIPVSRPASGDSDVATEQLNARAKSNGVSAQDLLRREGRL